MISLIQCNSKQPNSPSKIPLREIKRADQIENLPTNQYNLSSLADIYEHKKNYVIQNEKPKYKNCFTRCPENIGRALVRPSAPRISGNRQFLPPHAKAGNSNCEPLKADGEQFLFVFNA